MNSKFYKVLLWFFIILYIGYFSFYTVLRYRTLYASYYDLGIMHQTVFNTYRAITNHDPSRILELTNTQGPDQIKRPAIHNDIILALIAPLYLIYASPVTLLVLQSLILGLGGWFVFQIGKIILARFSHSDLISLLFAISYLLYPPMEHANMFDFHPVTFATTFLLAMFYFWLKKRYGWTFLFIALALLTKEEVGLTTFFFGLFTLFFVQKKERNLPFSLAVMFISLAWFVISIFYIIPHFRGGDHFALSYYGDFGDTPTKVILGVLTNPMTLSKYIFSAGTWNYLISMLGPLGFISIFSLPALLIAAPEFAINLLSNEPNLRNIYYQYSSVITPFIFISAIYGFNFLASRIKKKHTQAVIAIVVAVSTLVFTYLQGPLPGMVRQEIHPFKYPQKEASETAYWSERLKDENLKISATGHLAPFFTSRRYFYTFSQYYYLADYVVIRPNEIYNYPERNQLIPVYEKLEKDSRFELIYQQSNFEVFKKIND